MDFEGTRRRFSLPEGVIYLDGNSLGPLPVAAGARAERVLRAEWGAMLVTGWNRAGWIELPDKVGDRIAGLIGAAPGSVTMGDTLTVKVFQALSAALDLRPDRRVVLSDSGNFPTDLYAAEGLLRGLDRGHVLKVVAPEDVAAALDERVAALLLTHVDYRTGRMHDMAGLTERAHDVGALALWDLAHSAGAMPLDLAGAGVDVAMGCTYKYLNGGPGAPAFIYVRPDLAEDVRPMLAGWMGHEAPFAFDPDYRPAAGVGRMRVGTPPVLQLSVLDAALDVFDGVDMAAVRARSIELTERFIQGVTASCPGVMLASPSDPALRGSQVSLRHEQGYGVMQALIARGVIGDFRAPDIMRFGFAPLYVRPEDVDRAAAVLADVLASRAYEDPAYQRRNAVT